MEAFDSDSDKAHLELLYKKHISKKPITIDILKEYSKVKTKSKEVAFHNGLSQILGICTNYIIVTKKEKDLQKGTLMEELNHPKKFKKENYFIDNFNQYLKVNHMHITIAISIYTKIL